MNTHHMNIEYRPIPSYRHANKIQKTLLSMKRIYPSTKLNDVNEFYFQPKNKPQPRTQEDPSQQLHPPTLKNKNKS